MKYFFQRGTPRQFGLCRKHILFCDFRETRLFSIFRSSFLTCRYFKDVRGKCEGTLSLSLCGRGKPLSSFLISKGSYQACGCFFLSLFNLRENMLSNQIDNVLIADSTGVSTSEAAILAVTIGRTSFHPINTVQV